MRFIFPFLSFQEVQDDPIVLTKLKQKQLIWDEIHPVILDTQQLEYLFESRAKDLITRVSSFFCLLLFLSLSLTHTHTHTTHAHTPHSRYFNNRTIGLYF